MNHFLFLDARRIFADITVLLIFSVASNNALDLKYDRR